MKETRQGPATDWLTVVHETVKGAGDTLPLASLQPSDLLQVRTEHTLYEFAWEGDGWATLRTDRVDRPSGRVRVVGCALGAGTTIAPDRLFNGGSLEFRSADGAWVHRTTAIQWIRLVRQLG